jgi:hypothetical protein
MEVGYCEVFGGFLRKTAVGIKIAIKYYPIKLSKALKHFKTRQRLFTSPDPSLI